MEDHTHLRRAIALSQVHMAAGAGGPFGAVIVRDGMVLAEGWNQVTTRMDPTAHAEVVAIREACAAVGAFDLRGAVLYASCEPCPMCLAAAWWARIDRIVHAATREDAAAVGFDDEAIYAELARPREARHLPLRQALRDEAVAVLAAWQAKPDKVPY